MATNTGQFNGVSPLERQESDRFCHVDACPSLQSCGQHESPGCCCGSTANSCCGSPTGSCQPCCSSCRRDSPGSSPLTTHRYVVEHTLPKFPTLNAVSRCECRQSLSPLLKLSCGQLSRLPSPVEGNHLFSISATAAAVQLLMGRKNFAPEKRKARL